MVWKIEPTPISSPSMPIVPYLSMDIYQLADPQLRFKCGTYAWIRKKVNVTSVIYVGYSKNLMNRLGNGHHVIGKKSLFDPRTDKIQVWFTDTVEEAQRFEEELIRKLKPKYNFLSKAPSNGTVAVCIICKKEFVQKKLWNRYCSEKCKDYYPSTPRIIDSKKFDKKRDEMRKANPNMSMTAYLEGPQTSEYRDYSKSMPLPSDTLEKYCKRFYIVDPNAIEELKTMFNWYVEEKEDDIGIDTNTT